MVTTLTFATSATEALDRDNWTDYFAILLDRKLPDGSAEELLPDLRRIAPDAAILIITGNADLESTILALRAGASDYLMKPVEPDVLRTRLKRLADLRIAHNEIAERDAQLEFMIEHLPAAAAYVDLRSGSVHFNGQIKQISGYEVEQLSSVDKCAQQLFQDEASFRTTLQAHRDSGYSDPILLELRCLNDETRFVEFHAYSYDHHEVWLISDVTARRRREMQLRIRNQAMQSAAEAIVIAKVTGDDAKIEFVNQAFQVISGHDPQTVIGGSIRAMFGAPDDQSIENRIRHAIANSEELHAIAKCVREDGAVYWCEFSLAPVRSEDQEVSHVVCVMEDITERRETEAQLVQSERLAAIGQMVAGLAHESRNALQRGQACVDMLALDLEGQPELLETTEKLRRSLTDLHRHYEEVRNYAAPITLVKSVVNVGELIERVWLDLEAEWFARDFKLSLDVGESLSIEVDTHRISQVLRNLMENALTSCEDTGTLTITGSEIQDDETDSKILRLVVQDSGPGFSAEAARSAFVPFFTTRQKGTGLGMAICKRIVDLHEGTIRVLNPGEPGAAIELRLPIRSTTTGASE